MVDRTRRKSPDRYPVAGVVQFDFVDDIDLLEQNTVYYKQLDIVHYRKFDDKLGEPN
jgi:hypothetical protein